jgi:hypothetical protein
MCMTREDGECAEFHFGTFVGSSARAEGSPSPFHVAACDMADGGQCCGLEANGEVVVVTAIIAPSRQQFAGAICAGSAP